MTAFPETTIAHVRAAKATALAIDADPQYPWTVEGLAAMAGYTYWHFCKVFADVNGVAPMGYVRRVRMERAKVLLAGSKLPMKAVARACGYGAPNFAKHFRREVGVSPTEFRAAAAAGGGGR